MESETWKGEYFDGSSAMSYVVLIELQEEGVNLRFSEEKAILWLYPEIHLVPSISSQTIQLEKGKFPPQKLIIEDASFLHAFEKTSNWKKHKFQRFSPHRDQFIYYLVGMIIVIVVSLPVIYRWGIPLASKQIAKLTPLSWEEKLGEIISIALLDETEICTSPKEIELLQSLFQKIEHIEEHPYQFEVIIVDSSTMNALALPGGKILIYRGLLNRLDSPEALIGVLAHEMQHILQQHGLQNIIRASLFAGIMAIIGGDFSMLESVLDVVEVLSLLSYSRDFEIEADLLAIQMLQKKGITIQGMINFFEMVANLKTDIRIPSYLSTHPAIQERIENLKAEQEFEKNNQTFFVMNQKDWASLQRICSQKSELE